MIMVLCEPDDYELDMIQHDALIDEAVQLIHQLRYELGLLSPSADGTAAAICQMADSFVSQFDDVLGVEHG